MKHDIENAEDINKLVLSFYKKVLPDPIIGFIFTDIMQIDLNDHLPKIARFWHKILLPQTLEGKTYKGRTFEIHQHINTQCELNEQHFQHWVFLFSQTVAELYSGPLADIAITRAAAIAQSMFKGLNDKRATEHYLTKEQSGVNFFDPQDAV